MKDIYLLLKGLHQTPELPPVKVNKVLPYKKNRKFKPIELKPINEDIMEIWPEDE